MADPQNPNDQKSPADSGQLEPGESNARAVRRDPGTDPASGKPTGAAGTANQAGTQRVRMTRNEGGRSVGQVVSLPQDEAQRLIDSGAAEKA